MFGLVRGCYLARRIGSPGSLKGHGLQNHCVTNQSAVGRGILKLADAMLLNDRLVAEIAAAGGRVDDVFVCPHAPSEACACRKPNPGLIIKAAARHSLDLEKSILVGDALTDLQAGRNAGVGQNILVRTGRGATQLALPEASQMAPFPVFDCLSDVVNFLYPALL